MNIEPAKTRFQQGLKKILESLKRIGTDPYGDWRILLCAALVGCALFLAYSIRIFSLVNKGEFFVGIPREAARVDSIDRAALQDTLQSFTAKKLKFEELRTRPLHFDEPSI